jgi:wobble nucleotide-excising tRNase
VAESIGIPWRLGSERGGGFFRNQVAKSAEYAVRVYNKDFVIENLKWLTDEEGDIKPFAIIGEQNVEIEKHIAEKNKTLGDEEQKTGLRYEIKVKVDDYQKKKSEREKRQEELDKKLRQKAAEIKRNPLYNEVTYNISKIDNDIKYVKSNRIPPLCENDMDENRKLLREQAKANIQMFPVFKPSFQELFDKSNALLSKKIKPTETIQELINDAMLQEWVRNGIGYHRGRRTNCAFCGGEIGNDLWEKLDAHFSKESEELRTDIRRLIVEIEQEKRKMVGLWSLDRTQFYSIFNGQFDEKKKEWDAEIGQYCSSMEGILSELRTRETDIFKERTISKFTNNANKILDLQSRLKSLIEENNKKTNTLVDDQRAARARLRFDDVLKFINSIGYDAELLKVTELSTRENESQRAKEELQGKIETLESEISGLKNQLRDERKGAEKVNEYLNHYFGHNSLKLRAIEQEESTGFSFQIMRGDEMAHNLSEGECSLVSFCYFMAKLNDVATKDKELIIWIDDPVSSLDNNHIFFVFSLIEDVIARPSKNADGSNHYRYKQLLVSTHNLDFLKYLKCLSQPKKEEVQYFLVEGGNGKSKIQVMPDYLRNYITEFNYLFHQIYKCSIEKDVSKEHDCFYNFGNNLRKFLDAYLFYKYPSNRMDTKEKLKSFFHDDQTAIALTTRLDNELSHLQDIFDRSMRPIDIPEIPTLASYVLDRIKQKDEEQYRALMESIDKTK